MANRICFVELPAGPTGPTKSFYASAFGFPGGRRFHFRDPAGNELAAMQPE